MDFIILFLLFLMDNTVKAWTYEVCLKTWLSNQVLKHEPRLPVNFESSGH